MVLGEKGPGLHATVASTAQVQVICNPFKVISTFSEASASLLRGKKATISATLSMCLKANYVKLGP